MKLPCIFEHTEIEWYQESFWERALPFPTSANNYFIDDAEFDTPFLHQTPESKLNFNGFSMNKIQDGDEKDTSNKKAESIVDCSSNPDANDNTPNQNPHLPSKPAQSKSPNFRSGLPYADKPLGKEHGGDVKLTKEYESNRKPTLDSSDNEKSDEPSVMSEYTPSVQNKRKRRKRRDVIYKTILRECRRYFQVQLSGLTGFINSKKPRNDGYMYEWLKRFNVEVLGKEGTFEDNFYLACLLYPQELSKNIENFFSQAETENLAIDKSEFKTIAQQIHDTLYKYSHEKLEYFASKPQISFLFCYFYANGAGDEKEDPEFVEEYEFIRNKCMDVLNRMYQI